jgi:hypothetical protein
LRIHKKALKYQSYDGLTDRNEPAPFALKA